MKNLILLFVSCIFLASCGKEVNPPFVDFKDDDGDQIPNHLEQSEFDKYVSNFQQISGKEAKVILKLMQNNGDQKVIEGKIGFNQDLRSSLNQVVGKRFQDREVHYIADYFSEFTKGNTQFSTNKNLDPNNLQDNGGELKIIFDNQEMDNDQINLIKTQTGKFDQFLNGQVTKDKMIIENVSSKELAKNFLQQESIFFSNTSKANFQKKFFEQGVINDIKQKTYRFIVSTPEETNIYYVSTLLTINKFLSLAKIDLGQYQFRSENEITSLYDNTEVIEGANILIPLNMNEKQMGETRTAGKTYGLFAGNIRTIKNLFFELSLKENASLARTDGARINKTFVKDLNQNFIIDLEISRTTNIFHEETHQTMNEIFSGDWSKVCRLKVRTMTQIIDQEVHLNSLSQQGIHLLIDGTEISPTQDIAYIKNGRKYRRLVYTSKSSRVDLIVDPIQGQRTLGCFDISDCVNKGIDNLYLQTCAKGSAGPEAQLTLNYSAYIE